MPRPPRDTRAGVFHVYTHCVWAAPAYFRTDVDRIAFLREVARVTSRFEWTCIGFCLMSTHYHLMLEVPDLALPLGMQSLNYRYAVGFNRTYGMRGHAQFARYGAKRIYDDAHFLTTYAYMARNPVEAELCANAEDWPWSSHAATVGLAEPPSFVDPTRALNCFDGPPELAAARLRAYVAKS